MEPSIIAYGILLVVTLAAGIWRWSQLDSADRWMGVLVAVTIVQECIAYLLFVSHRNNTVSYHVYSPIELSLTSLFLMQSNPMLRKRKFMRWIVAVAVLAGLVNTLLFQGIEQFNTYYLLFESTAIVILCMASFYSMTMAETGISYDTSAFWITLCLFFFWTVTFIGWGFYNVLPEPRPPAFSKLLIGILRSANYLFYAGILLVFVFYKRLKSSQ